MVGIRFRHAADQSVKLLHGRAERHIAFLNAALEGGAIAAAGHAKVQSQFVQEGGEEREQALEHEFVAQRDGAARRGGLGRPTGREIGDEPLDEFLPLAEWVGSQIGQFLFARSLVVQRAAAAPGEDLAMSPHERLQTLDPAAVAHAAAGRGLADEGVLRPNPGGQETLQIQCCPSVP